MDLEPYTLSIACGHGLVARVGEAVMYIADTDVPPDPLLAAIDAVADSANPGAALAHLLATVVLGADGIGAPPFGVVAATDDGLMVLVRQRVSAEIATATDTHRLSGERAFTWVDEVVRHPVRSITVADVTAAGLSACPHTDLRAGVVPGGGFILHSTTAPREAPERIENTVAQSIPVQETTVRTQPSIGIASGRTPAAETSAQAPVAGYLGTEDGAVYPLDRNYVIGRDPLRDDAVRGAVATPIVVHHDQHVSRVHAYVTIGGSTVFVRDASTPAGTFIAAPGAPDWTLIGTGPTELEPEWSLRVGEQILTYHTQG